MLIRPLTNADIPKWLKLSKEFDKEIDNILSDISVFYEGFNAYMEGKIAKREAFIAVDRMSLDCMGIIAFSKTHNRITYFATSKKQDMEYVGVNLINTAIRQLDRTKDITVNVLKVNSTVFTLERLLFERLGFAVSDHVIESGVPAYELKRVPRDSDSKKGGSFHYNYERYSKWADSKSCPVCNNEPGPSDIITIKELEYSWIECSKVAQGRLFGKCHVLSKVHSEHFYDLSEKDMTNFMMDVQRCAKALHKVTGAIKINYEIHGNSIPHLHVHLFPRYLDDDFPSKAIDYHLTEPSPYESDEEFNWFIDNLREELNK